MRESEVESRTNKTKYLNLQNGFRCDENDTMDIEYTQKKKTVEFFL